MSPEEIEERITYHKPTELARAAHEAVRVGVSETMKLMDSVVPDGREKSLVFTKLEEAMFWANAGIARNHEKLADSG